VRDRLLALNNPDSDPGALDLENGVALMYARKTAVSLRSKSDALVAESGTEAPQMTPVSGVLRCSGRSLAPSASTGHMH
jgi:hypothetical protein